MGASWQACDWGGAAFSIALRRVVEESLRYGVLQRAHVLAPQSVVGHPALGIVVFGPGKVSHMANVEVHAGEDYFEDHAPTVHGLSDGVEQAVRQTGGLNDASLILAQAVVALGGCKPAPEGGGEPQVQSDTSPK